MNTRIKDTDYAFAVARIRANEPGLLTESDLDQLISAENYSSALRMLEEMGWIESEDREDIDAALKRHGMRVWELLNEVSPNISVLDFLIIKNDFHNIKAALKSFVTMHVTGGNQVLTDSFVSPSIVYPEMIKNALSLKKYDELPDFVQDAINKTYDVLIRTLDGQLADIILDSLALNCIAERAENTGNDFIIKTAELMCVTANIKIAYRATRTGKGREFLETALCVTKTLDKRQLLEASLEGMQELIAYIESTPYKDAAAYLAESASAFEKWCDDLLMSHVENAKYICFGVQPLIAYYIAKDAEIKSMRIILSCKHNNLPPEAIRERVRKLYV